MKSIRDKRYRYLIKHLRETRENLGITQIMLAERLKEHQSYVAKVETCERRLDVVELYEWIKAMEFSFARFFEEIGWIEPMVIAPDHIYPEVGSAVEEVGGVLLSMKYSGGASQVFISGISLKQYLDVEKYLVAIYQELNKGKDKKNRDAIHQGLAFAISNFPNANPSDIYQHIVYRIYLREYKNSDPEQSWRRASGEAMELYVQSNYREKMLNYEISVVALISTEEKKRALLQMGLIEEVGGSKLDVALYGKHNDEWIIFGGVHCKASLAERVSDDIPASMAMMRKGLCSILYTFDSKSFPPPKGNLINKGELGSSINPSDKRKYIEEHGAFDACFCYNTRSNPSADTTKSGKKIYVSDLKEENDKFPQYLVQKWSEFKNNLSKQ